MLELLGCLDLTRSLGAPVPIENEKVSLADVEYFEVTPRDFAKLDQDVVDAQHNLQGGERSQGNPCLRVAHPFHV